MLVEDDEEEEPGEGERDEDGDVVRVWPENLESVLLFFDLRTQWLRAGMDGARVGLDYKAAHQELEGRRVLDHEPFMRDLRVMELAAMEVFGEQAERRMRRMKEKQRAASAARRRR